MSIGKFEPSYFNAYSRPSSHHASSTSTKFEAQPPSEPSYFNGFMPLNEENRADKIKEAVEPFEELSDGQLKKYIHIDIHPNGGASVVRIRDSEMAQLSRGDKERLARLFFQEVFCEEPEHVAKHVIGIVHGAAKYMPELVSHLSVTRPELDIKVCTHSTACMYVCVCRRISSYRMKQPFL